MADPRAPGKDVQSATDDEFFDVLSGRRDPRAGNTSEARAAALRSVYAARVEPGTPVETHTHGNGNGNGNGNVDRSTRGESRTGRGSGLGWMKLATAAAIAGVAFGLTVQLAPWSSPDSLNGIRNDETSYPKSNGESYRGPASDDAAQAPNRHLPGVPKGTGTLEPRPGSAQQSLSPQSRSIDIEFRRSFSPLNVSRCQTGIRVDRVVCPADGWRFTSVQFEPLRGSWGSKATVDMNEATGCALVKAILKGDHTNAHCIELVGFLQGRLVVEELPGPK